MLRTRQGTIFIILFCQFVAAFSALGMPPFFSLFLKNSYGSEVSYLGIPLAGVLFIVPTFFAGICSPFWGKLADIYGKKNLLIRAQIGLVISFLMAGYAKSPFQFFLALMAQGILGGTFSASKAYLTTFLEREELAKGLNWMEAAPKAAMVVAPFIMGFLLDTASPISIYRYLALLPLLSAVVTFSLPSDTAKAPFTKKASSLIPDRQVSSVDSSFTINTIIGLQFVFGMSAVMTSPYFNNSVGQRFPALSHAQIGLLIGLPHLVYLASAAPFSRFTKNVRNFEVLIAGFALQTVAVYGQAQAETTWALFAFRVLAGMSMTLILIQLNLLLSRLVHKKTAGGLFGWLEGSARMSNVLGGFIASFAFGRWGAASTFFISAGTLLVSLFFLVYLFASTRKEKFV